jgi:hypothetical protein
MYGRVLIATYKKCNVVHSDRPKHAYLHPLPNFGSGLRGAVFSAGTTRSGVGQPVLDSLFPIQYDRVPRVTLGRYIILFIARFITLLPPPFMPNLISKNSLVFVFSFVHITRSQSEVMVYLNHYFTL